MKTLNMFLILVALDLTMAMQNNRPDLSKKEDLNLLGVGRIVEKDRSIIKNITLFEVKEYWIVYVKDGSIHDLAMDKIDRIEFRETKWGGLKIEFENGQAKIYTMQ